MFFVVITLLPIQRLHLLQLFLCDRLPRMLGNPILGLHVGSILGTHAMRFRRQHGFRIMLQEEVALEAELVLQLRLTGLHGASFVGAAGRAAGLLFFKHALGKFTGNLVRVILLTGYAIIQPVNGVVRGIERLVERLGSAKVAGQVILELLNVWLCPAQIPQCLFGFEASRLRRSGAGFVGATRRTAWRSEVLLAGQSIIDDPQLSVPDHIVEIPLYL